ncbi:MAG: glycosyltransferase [Desulfotomaculaceae bacterium]
MQKFSVIIPAYNSEKRLVRTLDSVKNQTCKNFEIVITDDGSRDNTTDTIREYIRRNPELEISMSSQPNRGIGAARNNAISRSTGDYLAFLDDDDIWYPDKLEAVAAYLKRHPGTDLVSHRVYKTYPDGRKKKFPNSKPKEPCYDSLLFKGNTLHISATVVNRKAVLQAGGFTEDSSLGAEDYELWLRLAYAGASFGFIESFLGEIASRRDSFSWNIEYMTSCVLNVLEFNLKFALLKCDKPEMEIRNAIKWRKAGEILSSTVKLCRKNDFRLAGKYLRLLLEEIKK